MQRNKLEADPCDSGEKGCVMHGEYEIAKTFPLTRKRKCALRWWPDLGNARSSVSGDNHCNDADHAVPEAFGLRYARETATASVMPLKASTIPRSLAGV